MIPEAVFAAFSIGLLGAGHCLGMCGGIAAALSFAIPESDMFKRFRILFTYNTGRILSYGLVGLVFGWLGQSVIQLWMQQYGMSILRGGAGVLLILMGLYLAQWSKLLVHLERAGGVIWKGLKPLSDKLMPVKNEPQALALGMVWGWLPCGLVYSTLAFAIAQPSPVASSMTMIAFGLGTLPAVFLGGVAGAGLKSFLQKIWFRRASALALMAFGAWTIWSVIAHAGHHGHEHHDHSGHHNHSALTLESYDDLYCRQEKRDPILPVEE